MTKSILIVDDNENLRKLLVWFLQPRGYETLQAATGKEAIEKAIAAQPSLILFGYSLTRHEWGGRCAGNKERSTHGAYPDCWLERVFWRALARRSTARWNGRLHGKTTFSASN